MANDKPTPSAVSWLARVEKFFTEDLWSEPSAPLHWSKEAWRHFLRFATHVVHGFQRHRLPMRAAALAYTSLLALVPLLAVAIAVSKGLLASKVEKDLPRVLTTLVENLAPQLKNAPSETTTVAQQEVVLRLQGFISNLDAGTLGWSGFILLAIIAISLLISIEEALNTIWSSSSGRPWYKRVAYYWTTITLGPALIFVAMAMAATPRIESLRSKVIVSPFVEGVVLTVAPFLVLWTLFAVFYFAMPNAKVRWRPALLGGVVGGTLWHLNYLCAFLYMSRVKSYTSVYGALALIPIFLIGLYFSWFIVLLGAEVARATQHFRQKPAFAPR